MTIDWPMRLAIAADLARSAEAWRQEPVEPRIAALVEGLNKTWKIRTLASCEGHACRRRGSSIYSSAPYVYFMCSPEVAESLSGRLVLLGAGEELHYRWRLLGCFDFENRLSFRLEATDLEEARCSWAGLVRHFVVNRRRINADLLLLARELPAAVNGR